MSALVFGFYGEGDSDYRFVKRIVERALTDLLPYVDIIPVDINVDKSDASTQQEIILRVSQLGYRNRVALIVFHLDADHNDTSKAFNQRFQPGYQRVQAAANNERGYNDRIIPIIPVRMTEAWMLVDYTAFKDTIGTNETPKDLGFPQNPKEIEQILKPKEIFQQAIQKSRGTRRRKLSPEEIYLPLAHRVRLENLAVVPAYQQFQQKLEDMLRQLNHLD